MPVRALLLGCCVSCLALGLALGAVGTSNIVGSPSGVPSAGHAKSDSSLRLAGSALAGRGWVGRVMVESLGWFGGSDFCLSPDRLHCAYMVRRPYQPGVRCPALQVFLDGRLQPEYESVDDLWFGPGNANLAGIAILGEKFALVADGRIGLESDSMSCWPVFSSDASHLAYVTVSNKRWRLVVDGRAGPAFDKVGRPCLSPDGNRVAYSVLKAKKWHVVTDNVMGPPFDHIEYITFSPDSRHVAYTAWTGGTWDPKVRNRDRGGVWHYIVDGKPGPDLLGIGGIRFTSDGNHWFYQGHTAERELAVVDGRVQPYDGKIQGYVMDSISGRYASLIIDGSDYLVLVDGKPGPRYTWASNPSIVNGGKHIAYMAAIHDSFCVVLDGNPGPWYDSVRWLRFSPDGEHYAYFAKKDSEWFVIRDCMAGAGWDSVSLSRCNEPDFYRGMADRAAGGFVPFFAAPDGHIAYVGIRKGKKYPVFDTTVGQSASEIYSQTMSPDGKRTAYATCDSGWSVVIDGRRGQSFASVKNIRFSPNSRHVFYTAFVDTNYFRRVIVTDSIYGPEISEIWQLPSRQMALDERLWFSPGGEHFAYSFTGSRDHVTVDLKPGPDFDRVWEPVFVAEDTVEYLAATGSTLYRVHCRP